MDYQVQRFQSTSLKAIESKQVTLIWGTDGWCYIPDLKLRHRFTETKYHRERWEGVIAMPQSIEGIMWTQYSASPLVWRETGASFDYFFETKKITEGKN